MSRIVKNKLKRVLENIPFIGNSTDFAAAFTSY